MPKYAGGERFKYPETEVLINKADIRTQDALDAFEADVTAVRLIELLDSPIPGNFDLVHLQAVLVKQSRTLFVETFQSELATHHR